MRAYTDRVERLERCKKELDDALMGLNRVVTLLLDGEEGLLAHETGRVTIAVMNLDADVTDTLTRRREQAEAARKGVA